MSALGQTAVAHGTYSTIEQAPSVYDGGYWGAGHIDFSDRHEFVCVYARIQIRYPGSNTWSLSSNDSSERETCGTNVFEMTDNTHAENECAPFGSNITQYTRTRVRYTIQNNGLHVHGSPFTKYSNARTLTC